MKATLMPLLAAVAALVLAGCTNLQTGGLSISDYKNPSQTKTFTDVVDFKQVNTNYFRLVQSKRNNKLKGYEILFRKPEDFRVRVVEDVPPSGNNWVYIRWSHEVVRENLIMQDITYHVKSWTNVHASVNYYIEPSLASK